MTNVLLSLLLILTGLASLAAMTAFPPAGFGVLAAGIGVRLLTLNRTS